MPSLCALSHVFINLPVCRNGVIDREELRALLESTDSGSEYAMTVRTLSIPVTLRITGCLLHCMTTFSVLPFLSQA